VVTRSAAATSRRGIGIRFALAVAVGAIALAAVAAVNDPVHEVLGAEPVDPMQLTGVAYGPRPEQVLDVHPPPDAHGPVPVVVFAHAGGWIGGTRVAIPDVIDALGPELGVAIVSIDYRLVGTSADGSSTNVFPAAVEDLDRAIRFVRAHAAAWGLDPDRLVVAGASAGGHLAALVGADPGRYVEPGLPPELRRVSPEVQGVVDYVGPTDFRTFPQAGGWAPAMTAALLGCAPVRPETCDPSRIEDGSVATHLHGRPPPAFFAYGEQDSLVVPETQGAPLAAAWAAQRGEDEATPPRRRSVWYEQRAEADHNFTRELDGSLLVFWLGQLLDGALR
jgi:acetyl esterase/lipase